MVQLVLLVSLLGFFLVESGRSAGEDAARKRYYNISYCGNSTTTNMIQHCLSRLAETRRRLKIRTGVSNRRNAAQSRRGYNYVYDDDYEDVRERLGEASW